MANSGRGRRLRCWSLPGPDSKRVRDMLPDLLNSTSPVHSIKKCAGSKGAPPHLLTNTRVREALSPLVVSPPAR